MKKELEERGRKEAILEKKVKKYDSKGGIYKL